jgi:hypothetical protein
VLLVSGIALIAVELSTGALSEPSPKLADPCLPRDGRTGGIDATLQRIVLDGLDGAACRLHATREELVLSLAPQSGVRRRWDEHTIDVPGFAAPILRRIIQSLPLDQLVRGGIRLSDLLG